MTTDGSRKASRRKRRRPSSFPTLENETALGFPSLLIAGVDEVGRGPLAGPVVAAAVILPPVVDFKTHRWLTQIQDSKLMEQEVREELVPLIQGWALAHAVGVATVEEIDRINIYHASHLAMCRAIAGLGRAPAHVLVDGNVVPKAMTAPATAIIKGDLKCLSIAAASILAKVWRDQAMSELDARYPGYGFAQHKGYPTPAHFEALKRLGATPVHRRSFAPVSKQLAFDLGSDPGADSRTAAAEPAVHGVSS